MINPGSIIRKIMNPPVFADEAKTLAAYQLYVILWTVMVAVPLMMMADIVVMPEYALLWLTIIVAAV
jgi:hypothetical protein